MNKPPLPNGNYDRDPNSKALKRRGLLITCLHQSFAIGFRAWDYSLGFTIHPSRFKVELQYGARTRGFQDIKGMMFVSPNRAFPKFGHDNFGSLPPGSPILELFYDLHFSYFVQFVQVVCIEIPKTISPLL